MEGHRTILLLGGNMGQRRRLLAEARGEIVLRAGRVLKASSLYETEPWGFESEQNFLNQVVVVATNHGPQELLTILQEIEKQLGRKKEKTPTREENDGPGGYSSRPIDIDILFYDQQIIDTPTLKVPHPQLHKRRFTLEPLHEVAPDMLHPVLKKTTARLLDECRDN